MAGNALLAFWLEDTVGLIPAAPFALLGFFGPFVVGRRLVLRKWLDEPSAWLMNAMYWCAIVVLLVLCMVGWVLGRYLVDVAPLLTLEGIVLIAISWQAVREPRVQHLFSWGVGGAAAYGVLVNTAFAAAGLRTILKLSLR
jgi:hypothetical protein